MRERPRKITPEQQESMNRTADLAEIAGQRDERAAYHLAQIRAARVRANTYGLTSEEIAGVRNPTQHVASLNAQKQAVIQAQAQATAQAQAPVTASKQPLTPQDQPPPTPE